jgi:O-antigen biosynthesis protein
MIGIRELRAGVKVFARHVRNAQGNPERLRWVLARTCRILLGGKAGGILQRHAVMNDLYANYPEWVRRYDTLDPAGRQALRTRASGFAQQPLISVLLPCYNAGLQDLREAIASVQEQIYARWELCIADDGSTAPGVREWLRECASKEARIKLIQRDRNGGISACTNSALEIATGDFVAFLDQDDVLSEQALLRMVEAVNQNPGAAIFYSDEDKLDCQGRRHAPHFKPDWNPEWAKTTNYVLHLCMMRITEVRIAGGLNKRVDGAQDWDLLLRVVEQAGDASIVHIPRVLYHWREGRDSTASGVYQKEGITTAQRTVIDAMLARRQTAADVQLELGGWWIRYRVPEPRPLVSIVIPTKDCGELLRRCVDSIFARTTYTNFELVLVDHASTEPLARKTIDALAQQGRAIVVPFTDSFNYAAECNLGVSRANGSVIVLLNNDIEVISPWWLDELVGRVVQPGVGLAGPLLLFPDGTIQHAGVILGANGSADRPYLGYSRGYAGIAGRAQAAQNVTALITACAAIRRDRYEEAGGMDESLAISHNDLDLCLRLMEKGYRNVWTPHAELYHHESASRGYDNSPTKQRQEHEEKLRFQARWSEFAARDANYNVNLALEGQLFALAFPPRVPKEVL